MRWALLFLAACGSSQARTSPAAGSGAPVVAPDAGAPQARTVANHPVANRPLAHPTCRERMTEPPPEPDTECGACYKDWEEAVAKFQPQRVLACTTCQTDADCGGTACARASGFGDAAIKVCTSYQCAGVWRARGADATCEPMRM